VEDEEIIAEDLAEKLGLLGYEVVGCAYGGEEAVELARRLKPSVVPMDIRLDGEMDGIANIPALVKFALKHGITPSS